MEEPSSNLAKGIHESDDKLFAVIKFMGFSIKGRNKLLGNFYKKNCNTSFSVV